MERQASYEAEAAARVEEVRRVRAAEEAKIKEAEVCFLFSFSYTDAESSDPLFPVHMSDSTA